MTYTPTVVEEIINDLRHSAMVDGYTEDQERFVLSIAERIEDAATLRQQARVDEAVAEVVAAESDDGYLIPKHARLLDRDMPVGSKLYAALPPQPVEGEAWGYVGALEICSMDRKSFAQVVRRSIPDLGITTPVYLTRPAARVSVPDGWLEGAPPFPWSEEWFIAVTTYGDRVVLRALPKEYAYDFKTADETYIKRDRIAKWMQFPDSEFIPATTAPDKEGSRETT